MAEDGRLTAQDIRFACDDVRRLRRIVADLRLEGFETTQEYSSCDLYHIYNGAGPDRWPEPPRELLTEALYLFSPAFFIHDVDFHLSDGSFDGWFRANGRCVRNCRRMVYAVFPVLSWHFLRNFLARRKWKALLAPVTVALYSPSCFQAWKEADAR